ncbi:RelA/SpoT family protein [Desulfomicrobium orale]|uniref:GTP pyrophosphokinase n=1 Tax=Desulfomicrobium orale DSM 12838 TaxID=888061 RepID=A0A0X8JS61_9BACT|nr:bifunctional (p)ppGpp synthetase/guanosine-3',5'-bis(diphosphate) 3'-pyrophosphohydrolase [Desulfomicrobium orale]AMD93777.1 GTP pyrophosphokinase [Desulfomicrobium orale DSM 12838]
MIRINDILDQASTYLPPADVALIQKAYVFSAAAHAGQVRLSGEPYLSHPLEVSNILVGMRLDAPAIAAGLLHDTVEDTDASTAQISEQFGPSVAAIVEGVTKIGKMNFESKEQAQAENIRKMILAMADDIRVILVKLADRMHNISTLQFQKEHKQRAIAQETLGIYAPLANRLGLYRIKVQLENESLRYLKPDMYAQISEGINRYQEQGQVYIDRVCAMIEDVLAENGIRGRVTGRVKHIYSIYHKMKQRGLTLDQVFDMIAFRVVVNNLRECYTVLGLVHSLWKPVPGKFKDYISMPKANMYQSLHSTVIGPEGERIEIQIRTEEMHHLAENGVAAHWAYKERGSKKAQDADRFSWLRQILDWQGDLKDSRDFMSTLSLDLFQDEVYVFTPKGQVKELPEGGTPVDFAYLIHTEVGNHCAGAKVNGRIVPLNTPLKNGDTVEIITDSSRSPSRDWLQFVKSGKARSRIKHWIGTEERARSLALARELLDKEGRRMGINVTKALKSGDFEAAAREFSFRQVDDLLSAVGHGRITPRQVLRKLLPKEEQKKEELKAEDRKTQAAPAKKDPADAIAIRGVDGVLTRYAQCCNPLPGDPIIGYISRGLGVTIHTQDCPNVANMEVDRLIDVSWSADEQPKVLPARIRVICRNQQGMLGQVCTLLGKEGVNIDSGGFTSTLDGKSEMDFLIEVKTTSQLYAIIEKLRKLDAVHEVTRFATG